MICGDLWRNGKARNPVCDKSSGNSICKHVWQWNSFRPTCETIYLVNKYEYPLHVGSGPTRSIWTWSKRMSGGRKEAGGETVCWWIFDHWQCKQARVHARTSELMLGQTYRAVIGSELPEFQGGKEHEGCWICYGWKWEEWTEYSSWNVTDDGNIGGRYWNWFKFQGGIYCLIFSQCRVTLLSFSDLFEINIRDLKERSGIYVNPWKSICNTVVGAFDIVDVSSKLRNKAKVTNLAWWMTIRNRQ